MKSICVFCGSNDGDHPGYSEAAADLGSAIARRGLTLVYGGAHVGLMGTLADATLAGGGSVVGVMPLALVEKEIAHQGLTEFREVESMHERKQTMADLADGFVALPGGVGTLEEIFEVWTWGQLGHHSKPVGFLNARNYFDRLLAFLDHQANERFMRQAHRDMLIVETDPDRMLDRCAAYEAPKVGKWIGEDER